MMMRLYASCVLRGFCWFGFLTYLGAFLNERIGLSTPQVGLVYMLGGSGYFAGSLFAAGPISTIPAMPLLAVGNGIMGVLTGVIMMGRLDRAVTVGLVPLLAFAAAIGWVGLVGLLSDTSPVGSGTTLVLNSSLMNLGAFGGSAAGGLMVSLGGYSALALGLPGFGILSAFVIWSGRPDSSGLRQARFERVPLDP
jgi:predicted MFS family arabinose efflux permease